MEITIPNKESHIIFHSREFSTAFTDPQNEEQIQKSIAALTKGKTLLVIAHRLSTIQNANQIIVLESGKILDSGTHNDLLKNCW